MPRKIDYDSWVMTADGAVGRVCSVYKIYDSKKHVYSDMEMAEVLIDNDPHQRIELPVTELKRIADPGRKLPPIEGMPEYRPSCAFCHRPFKPWCETTWDKPTGPNRRAVSRKFVRWNSYYGIFDTLKCAARFGEAAFNAGYRMKGRTK